MQITTIFVPAVRTGDPVQAVVCRRFLAAKQAFIHEQGRWITHDLALDEFSICTVLFHRKAQRMLNIR